MSLLKISALGVAAYSPSTPNVPDFSDLRATPIPLVARADPGTPPPTGAVRWDAEMKVPHSAALANCQLKEDPNRKELDTHEKEIYGAAQENRLATIKLVIADKNLDKKMEKLIKAHEAAIKAIETGKPEKFLPKYDEVIDETKKVLKDGLDETTDKVLKNLLEQQETAAKKLREQFKIPPSEKK